MDAKRRLAEKAFGPLEEQTSDSPFNKSNKTREKHTNNFSVHDGVVSGNFEANGISADYEFSNKKGISHVVYTENGKVLFDGPFEEFKKFHYKKNLPERFAESFERGRQRYLNRGKNSKLEDVDNFDVEQPKKKRRGCSSGCLISIIVLLLVIIFFGTTISGCINSITHSIHF